MARNFISRFRRVVYFVLSLGSVTLFASDVYILSYKTQVKNSQILHQSLYASLAMTAISKKPYNSTTILLDKQCRKADFFSCYESRILDYLLKTDVYIKSIDKNQKLVATTFSELQIRPQYVQVEFNDTFVKISLLK